MASQRGEKTKEKIIKHAIDLFYKHGYTAASTRVLVKSAKMTSSAIYNHFKNKDEILFTIIQRTADRVIFSLQQIIEEYPDPEKCLEQMITSMMMSLKDKEMRKEIAILNDELYQLPKELREKCYQRHREIFEIYRNVIHKIQKKKSPNQINDTVATFATLGATLWINNWYKDGGTFSLDEIARDTTKFIFKGLTG